MPCSIALPEAPSPTPPATPERKRSLEPATFQPYTDDPDPCELDEGGMLLQQRQIIQGPFHPSSSAVSLPHVHVQTKTRTSTISRRRLADNTIYRSRSTTSSRSIRGCSACWIPSWTGRRRAWRVRGDGLHVSPAGRGKTVRVVCVGLADSWGLLWG